MAILIELPNSKVEWIPSGKILLKTIYGLCTGPELEILFNTGFEKVRDEKGVKWLSDNRKMRPYSQNDVQWINENWLPRMLNVGWKYWGLVEPVTALGYLNMKNFDFYKDKGLFVDLFKSKNEGFEWLRTV